ncbi:cardiolipin synthase (CMP-forming) [[Candida] jaroonii]|uniref:Cardiolipin synthase (CMP-forming) n=1 Tax=[Candida] jaroonii TaxID=467808 RepID=A0ACA9Y1Z0_9ASCO|nr:cardiolipin synthase (CMP-forming) [[Candida] jaroonii]
MFLTPLKCWKTGSIRVIPRVNSVGYSRINGIKPLNVGRSRCFTTSRINFNKPLQSKQEVEEVKDFKHIEQKTLSKKILSENIYTVPNFLTMSRILTTPIITYYISTHQVTPAMILFTVSCITDFLDGFIARRYKSFTVLGSILDPIADKLLMGCCTIALLYSKVMNPVIGGLFIAKDFMLLLMGIYYRYTTLPPPKIWSRFINLSIPTVKVEPNMISKVNTGFQMVYIGCLVYLEMINQVPGVNEFLGNFEYLVGFTTLISAFSYIFSKKSIKSL